MANKLSSLAIAGNISFSMEVGRSEIRSNIDGLKIYIPVVNEGSGEYARVE